MPTVILFPTPTPTAMPIAHFLPTPTPAPVVVVPLPEPCNFWPLAAFVAVIVVLMVLQAMKNRQ